MTRFTRGQQLQQFEQSKESEEARIKLLPQPAAAEAQLQLENAEYRLTIPGFVRELIMEAMFGGVDMTLPELICECVLRVRSAQNERI